MFHFRTHLQIKTTTATQLIYEKEDDLQ